jgi:hypothetical protein
LKKFGNFDCPGGRPALFRGAEAAQNTGQIRIKSNQRPQSHASTLGAGAFRFRPVAQAPRHVAINGKPAKLEFSANKSLFN